jgi:hypothetical protein
MIRTARWQHIRSREKGRKKEILENKRDKKRHLPAPQALGTPGFLLTSEDGVCRNSYRM